MIDLAQNTLDGIAQGAAYGLLALGFTLIFGVMRRINLAFGASIMVGAFAGAWLHAQVEGGLWIAALGTLAGAVLASLYVERVSFAAMRGDAVLASMASSFAIWMQMEEAVALAFPSRTVPFPPLPPLPPLVMGDLILPSERLAMLIVAALVAAALGLLLHRTRFGLGMRALADSPEAARAMGVNVARTAALTFLLASLVGGVAAFLIAGADAQISPHFGLWATLKGLVAMVIGGLGSLRGALIGGLILGVVEAQAQWYLGAAWREIATYALLFIVLLALPHGLAGRSAARAMEAAARKI